MVSGLELNWVVLVWRGVWGWVGWVCVVWCAGVLEGLVSVVCGLGCCAV